MYRWNLQLHAKSNKIKPFILSVIHVHNSLRISCYYKIKNRITIITLLYILEIQLSLLSKLLLQKFSGWAQMRISQQCSNLKRLRYPTETCYVTKNETKTWDRGTATSSEDPLVTKVHLSFPTTTDIITLRLKTATVQSNGEGFG